jgi:hypothetical protein
MQIIWIPLAKINSTRPENKNIRKYHRESCIFCDR